MDTLTFPAEPLGGPAGSTIQLTISETGAATSPHSGRALRTAHAHCTVFGSTGTAVIGAMVEASKAKGGIVAAAPSELAGTHWRIDQRQMMYTGQEAPNTRYTYQFDLTEIEELAPTEVRVDTISLRPERYTERFDNGAIIINARVHLSGDEDTQFRTLVTESEAPYHSVVRTGVSDTPLQMRFGRVKWREHDGGHEYAVVLVQDAYDAQQNRQPLLLPDLELARRLAAHTRGLFRALFATLIEKGVLTDADVQQIRDTARRTTRADLFALDEVSEFEDDEVA